LIGTIRATGSAAVSLEVAPGSAWQLEDVRVHLNAVGGAGSLTITADAGAGEAYDVVLASQDMTAAADYVYLPTRPLVFDADDKVVIAWENAGGKTYGVEARYSSRG
jgi:hypothetical protein